MACSIGRDCPSTTLGELARNLGVPDGGTDPGRTVERQGDGPTFICDSTDEPMPVCKCGHWADVLCDWPMGRGKTCDIALCKCCSHEIGDDLDACVIHWHIFTRKTGVQRIYPARPRIVNP